MILRSKALLPVISGELLPMFEAEFEAGAMTETSDMGSREEDESSKEARMAAAESSTDGTLCSSVSVALERAMRCGFGGCALGGEGQMGSMSLSKIADEEE